ncbi:ATP-binding cassette domain-containing protein [Thermocrinis minervae]|uniref:Molybdate transport system ATP-binding protein n=1 Tax=Thermocrinis minervae TaxID=381751 RepID=A0A1M6SLB0_9AQUI|nr:ATP-binding cassette domain-containing protein [Thermocrinis minervae]SHK45531.1 molybdate transport system ATP-binding protein [Thermocrinis minervae]
MIKAYLKKTGLRGSDGDFTLEVELEVNDEIVVIFGPSGSGKTTILRLIAGLEKADEGYIYVNGEVWLDTKKGIDIPPYKRSVGFVFQEYALFPNMTVYENVAYAMKIKDPSRVEELLKMVDLWNLRDAYPNSLSGGQKQRIALVRALARQPKVLLLDEPFSSLDEDMTILLEKELKNFQRSLHIPTLVVTHLKDQVQRLADRVYHIKKGRFLNQK